MSVVLLAVACLVGAGCADTKPVVQEGPPPPVKVNVTAPQEGTFKDAEGVRRVAVCLAWERQPNARIIGRGFSDGGLVVEMELAQPLDEVVQLTVASAFKELGFNVALAPAMHLERAAEVRTHLERHQSDYIITIVINEFLISTSPIPDAPTFGKVNLELQLFGPKGYMVAPVMVVINTGWKLSGEKPGHDELRRCVEDVLKEITRKVTTDVNMLNSLGLTLPAAAAASLPPAGSEQ